ncbi:MAG: hypothetical protein HXS45_08535 [Theionarchaea archaeon]|nr:hypothetical protein [Theionarchaea archaeon]
MEKEELWEKTRFKDSVIEELKKENYRISLDMGQLENENRQLRKEIAELKGC